MQAGYGTCAMELGGRYHEEQLTDTTDHSNRTITSFYMYYWFLVLDTKILFIMMQAGYGTRAMELLGRYYEGQLTDLAEVELEDKKAGKKNKKSVVEAAAQVS